MSNILKYENELVVSCSVEFKFFFIMGREIQNCKIIYEAYG
jgi:hypothetical protein